MPSNPNNQKPHFTRKHLPHIDTPNALQAITFRLADSIPKKVLEQWQHELQHETLPNQQTKLRTLITKYEDQAHGSCILNDPHCASIVKEALQFHHPTHYKLIAWCVMPNHVHALIRTAREHSLSTIVHSWKSYTAHTINKHLNRSGPVWHPDYHDRYIRDQAHLEAAITYIHNNPVKSKLATSPHLYPHSSAHKTSEH